MCWRPRPAACPPRSSGCRRRVRPPSTTTARCEEEAHADALKITVRPDAPIQIVLTGHYDTVFPADSRFQTVATRPDGALNGPGVADMKGGISVMLAALEAFETHPDRHGVGWTVLLSPDEEIGSPASAPLLAELGARGHIGLTYEPALADGTLAGARKGSGNYHLIVTGRAAPCRSRLRRGPQRRGRRRHHRRRPAWAERPARRRHRQCRQDRGRRRPERGRRQRRGPPSMCACRTRPAADWIDAQVRAVAETPPFEGLTLDLHGGFTRAPKPMDAAQTRPVRSGEGSGRPAGPAHRLETLGRGVRGQ